MTAILCAHVDVLGHRCDQPLFDHQRFIQHHRYQPEAHTGKHRLYNLGRNPNEVAEKIWHRVRENLLKRRTTLHVIARETYVPEHEA